MAQPSTTACGRCPRRRRGRLAMPSVAHAYHGVRPVLNQRCTFRGAGVVLRRRVPGLASFNAGWFNHVDEATGHAFTDLFDLPRAASMLRPCRLVSDDLGAPPVCESSRAVSDLHPINASWPHWEWFGKLVAALRRRCPCERASPRSSVCACARRSEVDGDSSETGARLGGAGFCDVGRFPVRRCWRRMRWQHGRRRCAPAQRERRRARLRSSQPRRRAPPDPACELRRRGDGAARHGQRRRRAGDGVVHHPVAHPAVRRGARAGWVRRQRVLELRPRRRGAARARRRGPSFAYDCNVAPGVCELRRVGECSVVGR